jgi:hypothetical protein
LRENKQGIALVIMFNRSTAPPKAAQEAAQEPSPPQQAPAAGFFNRFINRARIEVTAEEAASSPSVVEISVISPVNAPSDSVAEDVHKLYQENERLRIRCNELVEQSALNQQMLQDCMAVPSSSEDEDELKAQNAELVAENALLEARCAELVETGKQCDEHAEHQLTSQDSTLTTENIELAAENARLEAQCAELAEKANRCDEYAEQSKLNQDMLQELMDTKKEDDAEKARLYVESQHYTEENDGLGMFCEQQSAKLKASEIFTATHEDKVTALRETIKDLEAKVKTAVKNAEVAGKNAIKQHKDARSWERQYSNLRVLGMEPPAPANQDAIDDLTRRVTKLTDQNKTFNETVVQLKTDNKARVLFLSEEANSLTVDLRHAEAEAKNKGDRFIVQSSSFKMLLAEYDAATEALSLERNINKDLKARIQSRNPYQQIHNDDVLTMELTKAQSAATENEKLVETYKRQQQHLLEEFKNDKVVRAQQAQEVDALHTENAWNRRRFEEMLQARDQRIDDLARRLQAADTERLEKLEEKLKQATQEKEDEVTKRVAEAKAESDRRLADTKAQADECLSASKAEADKLVADSKAKADLLIAEAKTRTDVLLAKRAAEVQDLVDQRAAMQTEGEVQANERVQELEEEAVNLKKQMEDLVKAFGSTPEDNTDIEDCY